MARLTIRWALIALTLLMLTFTREASAATCRVVLVTAYTHTGNLTADGTSTYGNVGAIAAGGYGYELGQEVWVEGVGRLRIADRGHLGTYQVDRLLATHQEAIDWGAQHLTVCG